MELQGVGKRYGRWVLREVDLAVGPGELVRIGGANGSGKSTLLKLVGGLERPSSGRVEVQGRRAYVPERFPPALPFDARSYLHHLGRVHGLGTAEAVRRAGYWLERFGITEYAGTPLSRLSKGTCQKIAVVQALIAEPDVLLLDEAWTGLDQEARALLDQAAVDLAAQGGRVLFVDHDPARLAGAATTAYTVEAAGLRRTELDVVSGRPVVIEAVGAEGVVRLESDTEHSDAVLSRLLAAGAHIRSVALAGGAEARAIPKGDDPSPGAPRPRSTGGAPRAWRVQLAALVRYQVELLLRSQRWLPPFLAYVLLVGLGWTAGESMLAAYGYVTAVLLPVAAWYVRCTATGEGPAARACLAAAVGPGRLHLAGLLTAGLVSSVLGLAGLLTVWAFGGRTSVPGAPPAPLGPTLLAALLGTAVSVLLGVALGALTARPVLSRAQYGIPLSLAGSVLALALPGSPANDTVRALIAAATTGQVHLPLLAPVEAALIAVLAALYAMRTHRNQWQ